MTSLFATGVRRLPATQQGGASHHRCKGARSYRSRSPGGATGHGGASPRAGPGRHVRQAPPRLAAPSGPGWGGARRSPARSHRLPAAARRASRRRRGAPRAVCPCPAPIPPLPPPPAGARWNDGFAAVPANKIINTYICRILDLKCVRKVSRIEAPWLYLELPDKKNTLNPDHSWGQQV